MIIQNGNIEFKHKVGGGLDADGYPVKATEEWSEPVPCQYWPKRYNLQGRTGGNATVETSFEILVAMPLPVDATEQLRLTDMAGVRVGEYSVISSQELRAVQEIKITV